MADVRRLARNIGVDVSLTGVDGTWLRLPGRVDNNLTFAPNLVDATDTDSDGFGAQEITLQNGSLAVQYNSLINAGTPNPAQQLVEDTEGQFGDDARLWVRAYDLDGGTRGWKFVAIVTVAPQSTAVADLRKITATLTMDGDTVTKMTPAEVTAAIGSTDVPVITSVTPSGAGSGDLVTITGQHFNGATGVTIDSIAMTDFQAISDSTISAILPSDTAGTVAVVVTTAAGSSTGFNYTRAA